MNAHLLATNGYGCPLTKARASLAVLLAKHQAAKALLQTHCGQACTRGVKDWGFTMQIHCRCEQRSRGDAVQELQLHEIDMQHKHHFEKTKGGYHHATARFFWDHWLWGWSCAIGVKEETEEAQRETQGCVTTTLRSSIQRWDWMVLIKDTQMRYDASSSLASNLHHSQIYLVWCSKSKATFPA